MQDYYSDIDHEEEITIAGFTDSQVENQVDSQVVKSSYRTQLQAS